MTEYIVHLYREMRLTFTGIQADTLEAAAAITRDKATGDADNVEDCEGETLSALVDVAGDEEFEHSRFIDFEQEKQRKVAPKLLAALEAVLPYAKSEHASLFECWKRDGESVSELEAERCGAAIDKATIAIAEADALAILPDPGRANSRLRQALEDVAEWLETGMIAGVHYDDASVAAALRETLTATAVHALLEKRRQIALIWSIDDVQGIRPDLDEEQAWEVLQNVDHYKDAELGITWLTLEMAAADLFGDASETAEVAEA